MNEHTKEQLELAHTVFSMRESYPAGFLSMCGLLAATTTAKTAAALARDIDADTASHAAEAVELLKREVSKEATNPDLKEAIPAAVAWLNRFFLDERTPAQRAADTRAKRKADRDKEWREEAKDMAETKEAARAILRDPDAKPADKLNAAAILGGMGS